MPTPCSPFRKYLFFTCVSFLVLGLGSCGGGGGGGGVAPVPLSPPAFTDLAGTQWDTTDKAGANSCGVAPGTVDAWVLHIGSQTGNTLSFHDQRDGDPGTVDGTMSGYSITYSGVRHPVPPCTDMSARYSIEVNKTASVFTGTATITCNDPPGCSISSTVTGTRLKVWGP